MGLLGLQVLHIQGPWLHHISSKAEWECCRDAIGPVKTGQLPGANHSIARVRDTCIIQEFLWE